MIPDKVKNLFAFIDFLDTHKNAYAEKYAQPSIKLLKLKAQKDKLSPSKNYKERQQYDAIQKEIDEIAPIIQNNVVNPIVEKLMGLRIWDGDGSGASIWNNSAGAISELIENFADADIEEVKKYKQMYLAFRAEHYDALRFLDLTIANLDEVLKPLFDYFKDTDKNEFEDFEERIIQVGNVEQIANLVQKGHKKFSLPFDFMHPSNGQQTNAKASQSLSFEKHFQREFDKTNVPFKDVLIRNQLFKDELFKQFCNAEKKPCFALFLDEFYTEEQLKQGFEEVHKQIPVSTSKETVAANFVVTTPFESRIMALHRQFIEMAVQKNLSSKYYCPDIEKTAIVQALKDVNDEYELLKNSVFDEKTDKYKEAEIRAKSVISKSAPLESFALLILERLKQDNENIHLHFKKADGTKVEFWQALKSNFNNAIIIQEQANRFGTNRKEPDFSYIQKKSGKEPAAPVVKRFCELVNDSKLMIRGFDESAETFCERVCSKYSLRYRVRVSKHFLFNKTPKANDTDLKKVIQTILPNIPNADRKQIEAYINNDNILYG